MGGRERTVRWEAEKWEGERREEERWERERDMEGSKVEKSQVEDEVCEIENIGDKGSETENGTMEESHHFEDSNQMLQINPTDHVRIDPILLTTNTLPPTTSFLPLINTSG